jgi:hypothetical protein
MSEPAENQFLLKLPKEARDHLAGSGDENRHRRESAASKKKDVAIENVYFPEIPCIPLRNGVPDGFS